MSENENTMNDSTILRNENDIQASKQLTNTKGKMIKNVTNQSRLRAINLNLVKNVEKEGKDAKKDTTAVKLPTKELQDMEKARHSPLKEEVLPLFVEYERKSKIYIHHKPSLPAVRVPVLPTREEKAEKDDETVVAKLKDQLKAAGTEKQSLDDEIKAAETVKQEKTKKLNELRQESKSRAKQLTELNQNMQQIEEYKTRNQSLKAQIQEQHDMYKELSEILSSANEEGLNFEKELQPKEDEINDLLNQLSEVKYRIQELQGAKE